MELRFKASESYSRARVNLQVVHRRQLKVTKFLSFGFFFGFFCPELNGNEIPL